MAERDGAPIRRVAFLTPEFPTEAHTSGGIASYVAKMALSLQARGVTAEVFVPSAADGETAFQGVRVHRVAAPRSLVARAAARGLGLFVGSRGRVILHLLTARVLAAALQRRHAEAPFEAVQSANHQLTGWSVPQVAGRVHAIRISTSRRLYDRGSGALRRGMADLIEYLDVRAMRRADVVYAPSAFLAGHFRREHGLDVRVLRPPAELGDLPALSLDDELPPRYLVHFGSLGARKGTDAVAAALPEAWVSEPGLRMVWVGPIADATLARFRSSWGEHAGKVMVLGLREKPELYRVVQGALASVLPSTVDNLPNTVIESLLLEVPVIGSDGASIDELVEHGKSGLLVQIGGVSALARAMARAWCGDVPWAARGFEPPAALAAMRPDRAVQAFLDLAGEVRSSRLHVQAGDG